MNRTFQQLIRKKGSLGVLCNQHPPTHISVSLSVSPTCFTPASNYLGSTLSALFLLALETEKCLAYFFLASSINIL